MVITYKEEVPVLPVLSESPPYCAKTDTAEKWAAGVKVGAKVTLHEPDESAQLPGENVPFALADQLTVPVGDEPVTAALQVVEVPVTTLTGLQVTRVAEALP